MDGFEKNQMKKYELLDHTADVKFRAYGKDMDEAFANAILAITSISAEPEALETSREKQISLESKNEDSLLFDLIDQLIFLADTENFITGKVEKISVEKTKEGYSLTAVLKGDNASRFGSNLKAPTYSEMVVEKKEGGWLLQAVIDI